LQDVLGSLDTSQAQKHNFLVVDFNDSVSLKEKLNEITDTYHILINNTGGPAAGLISEANQQLFEDAFKMHLVNNQILVQNVVEGMKKVGFGRIINILSTSVKAPIPGLGVSNTIRAAVANWAKTLSIELGSHGITVNNILPGFTNTNRLKNIIINKANKQQKSIDEVSIIMRSSVPANRFGEAFEVANAIAFLCTPAAAYINGINLPVDGGRTQSL
jgi:3-oxoacyl-[acyl-carrier protein] reductase